MTSTHKFFLALALSGILSSPYTLAAKQTFLTDEEFDPSTLQVYKIKRETQTTTTGFYTDPDCNFEAGGNCQRAQTLSIDSVKVTLSYRLANPDMGDSESGGPSFYGYRDVFFPLTEFPQGIPSRSDFKISSREVEISVDQHVSGGSLSCRDSEGNSIRDCIPEPSVYKKVPKKFLEVTLETR